MSQIYSKRQQGVIFEREFITYLQNMSFLMSLKVITGLNQIFKAIKELFKPFSANLTLSLKSENDHKVKITIVNKTMHILIKQLLRHYLDL